MKAFDDFETQIQCEEAYLEQPDIGAGNPDEHDTPTPEPKPSWLTSKAPIDPMDEFSFIFLSPENPSASSGWDEWR